MTRHLSDLRRRQLSPATYRRITLLAVWALGFIIVTGGAVRLSGSGLGCPDWPTCGSNRVVAPWQYHAMVEFGNRVVTGAVSLAVVAAVLGALVRVPRRRDLIWLAGGLVLGLIGQVVLGGEAVRHQLAPQFVMGHFLLSMVLLADAVVLHHRAGFADGPPDEGGSAAPAGPAAALVSAEHIAMGWVLVTAAGIAIVLGTVVTSTGPHGGDPKAKRFRFSLHEVARLHGSAVVLFLALTVVALWTMVRSGAPRAVVRRGEVLLSVVVLQGGIGYTQYFSGVPAWLVGIHITLATVLWVVTLRFALGLTRRPATAIPASEPGATRRALTRAPA